MNEIVRILRKLADDIAIGDMSATNNLQIRDVYGNQCGTAQITRDGAFVLSLGLDNDALHAPGEEPAY